MYDLQVGDEVLREGEDQFWVSVDDGGQRGADLQNGSLYDGGTGEAFELSDGVVHHVHSDRQLYEQMMG